MFSVKNITIIAIILVVIATGFFVWFFAGNKDSGTRETVENFFPLFGFPKGDNPTGTGREETPRDTETDGELLALRQISDIKTAGAIIFTQKDERSDENIILIRYVERATGHIYEVDPETMDRKRISNTTVPKIYEALWGNGGENVILRYINDEDGSIESFVANIPKTEEGKAPENELSGLFLRKNITQITLSPDKDSIFYLEETDSGVIGATDNMTGGKEKQIFTSKFTEWLPQWATQNTIFLTTKPSRFVPGYVYTISSSGVGALNKVLGNVNGLTTLASKDGSKIIYSGSTQNGFFSGLYTEDEDGGQFPINTLPEKCAWDNDSFVIFCGIPQNITPSVYPDEWYQGLVSFSDQVWSVDTKTGKTNILVDPVELLNVEMDIVKPSISEGGEYLLFTNKKDMTLWVLELSHN